MKTAITDFWTTILDFADSTTARVGTQLVKDFGQVQASQKIDGSLVTQADKWADREIQDAIASTFKGYGILSEEGEHIFPDTEWCWVIDPLDGTTNFTRGIPLWAISLWLLYQGTPVFGYVYLPPLAQAFHGFWPGDSGLTTPTGAFLNHHPILQIKLLRSFRCYPILMPCISLFKEKKTQYHLVITFRKS